MSLHRQQSHPGPIVVTPRIYTANLPDAEGQFSLTNQPIPHTFGVWEETQSTRRKPTQTGGERANSTQTVTQVGNQTRVPGAVRQQC